MSSASPIIPPAIKNRGRPLKAPASNPATATAAPTKPAMRAASTKSSQAKTINAQKEKKRILNRVSTYTANKASPAPAPPTPTPTSVPSPAAAKPAPAAPAQATPATPTTSKIIDEVRAAGAFKDAKTAPEQVTSAASAHPRPSPKQAPIDLPPAPSQAPPRNPPHASSQTGRPAFARAAPAHPRARPQQRYRVIEPTPNSELPSKYKPAMRRVTTIMVGIPIILVVGYELYNRARSEIRSKWQDGERV